MKILTKHLKGIITILALILFSMCSKMPIEQKEDNSTFLKKENLFVFDHNTFKNKDQKKLVLEISNDPDWLAYKKISNELISILILNNIDLNNYNNYNENFFYSQLGSDSASYKNKFKLGKEHATKMYRRYFSDMEICLSCNTLTLDKKKAYAKALDIIRNTKSIKKNNLITLAEAPDVPQSPDCWNLKFFACGGICAITIEIPPAFALCLALCAAEYCTTPE